MCTLETVLHTSEFDQVAKSAIIACFCSHTRFELRKLSRKLFDMSVATSLSLPLITIRCDWDESLRGRDKDAWISCKYRDQPSTTAKLELRDGKVTCSDGFEVLSYSGKSITIKHKKSNTTILFVAPRSTFPLHNRSCTRVAVTSGGLGLSAGSCGELEIWESERGVIRRTLEGHVGDVYQCCWFPSGVVVLAGGADWRTRIWCAQTGGCPVTLTGHTAPVTDLAIVDKGRNVITASKDGTSRLWDVGESQLLGKLCELPSSILACVIASPNQFELSPSIEPLSEREIGTTDKVLAVGCEDGMLVLIAIASRAELARKSMPAAVTALAIICNVILAVGLENGQIHLVSLIRRLETIRIIHESNSPVKSLLAVQDQLLFVGLSDGVCIGYHVPMSDDEPISLVRLQLTGSDFEPINDLSYDGRGHVYTAARDGSVRKYEIGDLSETLFI